MTQQVIPPDPIVLPADQDKLARWQGDHAALLARLQESYGDFRLLLDLAGVRVGTDSRRTLRTLVGELIREAVEHMEKMPR